MGKTRDLFKKIIGVRLPVPVPVVGYKARRRAADFPFPEPVAGLGVSLLSFPRSPGLPRGTCAGERPSPPPAPPSSAAHRWVGAGGGAAALGVGRPLPVGCAVWSAWRGLGAQLNVPGRRTSSSGFPRCAFSGRISAV